MSTDLSYGLEELAGLISFYVGAWHDFGYETPPAPDCHAIPPLGERSAKAITDGHNAIKTIDELSRQLHGLRAQLISELRQNEEIGEAPMRQGRDCGCPEDEGLVRHQRGTCSDPVVARLGWYFELIETIRDYLEVVDEWRDVAWLTGVLDYALKERGDFAAALRVIKAGPGWELGGVAGADGCDGESSSGVAAAAGAGRGDDHSAAGRPNQAGAGAARPAARSDG